MCDDTAIAAGRFVGNGTGVLTCNTGPSCPSYTTLSADVSCMDFSIGWRDNATRRGQYCLAQGLRRGLQAAGGDLHSCVDANHGSGARRGNVRDSHEVGFHVQS